MADGTKFKKFVPQRKLNKHNQMLEKLGKAPIEISKRGEVKIRMGIRADNTLVPLGAWTSEAWKTIGKFIYKANNQNKKVAKNKVANCTVTLIFILIDLGRTLTLRAPTEIIHLIYCFGDRESIILLHDLLV